MVRRKENKKFNLIKLIGLLLFACGMFMIVYNYSTKVKLDENNDTKIEDFGKLSSQSGGCGIDYQCHCLAEKGLSQSKDYHAGTACSQGSGRK